MTKAEAATTLDLGPGARVGIVAGGGILPVEVAAGSTAQGHRPFVVLIEGEADRTAELTAYEHRRLSLEQIGSLIPLLKRKGVTHVVLAGEIKRRPKLRNIRLTPSLLAMIPQVVAALARGDDGLLRIVTRGFEARGFRVLGAHEVVPRLAAAEGVLTRTGPEKQDWLDIDAARSAAKAIGALDIGQAAIAVGGRVIALEGIEGTAALLDRARLLRGHGRIAGKTRGVLVKCAKPGQELRADLPSIGPQTVEAAHAAGLAGIGVEAGHSLVLDGPATIARANALGLFIVGLPTAERANG